MSAKTRPDETTDWVSGTVGEDMLTVHKLVQPPAKPDEPKPGLEAACGAGEPDDQKDVWQRAVNCPACLAL